METPSTFTTKTVEYEGTYRGEGFNRILKPTANRSSHQNRSFNLLRNIHREKAMAAVQENFDTNHNILDMAGPIDLKLDRS